MPCFGILPGLIVKQSVTHRLHIHSLIDLQTSSLTVMCIQDLGVRPETLQAVVGAQKFLVTLSMKSTIVNVTHGESTQACSGDCACLGRQDNKWIYIQTTAKRTSF